MSLDKELKIEDWSHLQKVWKSIIQDLKGTSLSPSECDRLESEFRIDEYTVRSLRPGGVDSRDFELRVNGLESELLSTLSACKTRYQEKRRRDRVDLLGSLSKALEALVGLFRRQK
ncbi:MAG: hypothetical protein MAG715_01299 [Methanonatronarchaeales archaeon]|nr:hypothetical protein [Methanonatronarchaeales archaeon]